MGSIEANCAISESVIMRLLTINSKIIYLIMPRVIGFPAIPAGPKVIKRFSSSAQLSIKCQLLINAEIVKISGKFIFKPKKWVIYPSHKC